MELNKVLPTYGPMILFGLAAGVFASAVYLITYNLWSPVFNLVSNQANFSRLVMDLFIAGMHLFVIFALVPMLAGAVFIVRFYNKVSLVRLILANTVATIIMGTLFYALTTYAIAPYSLDGLMPLMTQVVEFIVWSSAGAFIAYLMIYQAWINPGKNNLKQTGTLGLALISLAAIAPPAITYVATII
jgi:hypothetical protein